MMEPLFKVSASDESFLLHMKNKLMSGTESLQIWVVQQISKCLKETYESERSAVVRKLIKSDMISTLCDVMQAADKDFVKVVLECVDLISVHKEFYENHDSILYVTESMIRLSYFKNKSFRFKSSAEFEDLVLSICNILIRSEKYVTNLDAVCVPQQIILFCKDLDIQNLQKYKLKFTIVKIVNIITQQLSNDDNNVDIEMCIDVCHDALKSMAEIVKCSDDDDTILLACTLLCGTCAGSSRLCTIDLEQENQKDINLDMKCADLSICVYDTMMNTIIPYVKDADLSRIDSKIEFYKNFVFCLNELYRQENYNHDDLSNHLTANGYLKHFLHLTVQLPENLRRSVCLLLSRILSVLGRSAFSTDTNIFANMLHHSLLQLPKDPMKWNETIARDKKAGMALMILMYYHYHGTSENFIPLESLITRIMLLSQITPSILNPSILKPLWFLFAVTSLSHSHPNLVHHYEDAVTRLIHILQYSELSNIYTHHIDLVHYCLKCSNVTQDLMKQILNLWMIESDGDIKPLLSLDCDKVVTHLLIVIQLSHPERIVSLAAKGLRQVIQLNKDNEYVGRIAEIVWHMLPNILSSYQTETVAVAHIKAALELANIVQPPMMPKYLITRIADKIVYIILQQNTDLNFVTLVVTQAHIVLVTAMANKSNKVLPKYIQKRLLKELCVYGFSKERSQLSKSSLALLGYIIHCQQLLSIKCRYPLKLEIKNLVELLTHATKSLFSTTIEMQFICELLTQNVDGSAIVLQNIETDANAMDWLINFYEVLMDNIYIQKDPMQKDETYKCLIALLHFCNIKATTLISHLCTTMSNYDFIFHVVNSSNVSSYSAEFVTVWLDYRKKNCNDISWNSRSLFKTPFDESLDHLKQYCTILQNKELNDACLALQRALSQFE